jgi:hypothetical protein
VQSPHYPRRKAGQLEKREERREKKRERDRERESITGHSFV